MNFFFNAWVLIEFLGIIRMLKKQFGSLGIFILSYDFRQII
jgi:hypothetical protein